MVWSDRKPVAGSTGRERQRQKLRILFGAGDKEGARLSQPIEAREIQGAGIEQVKGR
jgi:hypothetical protein